MINNEQAKYLAEIVKITAIGQFGYFGYKSLESIDHTMFYISSVVFVALIVIGTSLLSLVKEKTK